MFVCSKERMEDKIKTFSKFGATGNGGITRYSLSAEAIMARDEFVKRMKKIGAEIKTDDMANVYAVLKGSDPSLPAIAMGSHCDSVKNGGNYDGILGVIGAMEVLETVVAEKIPHKHDFVAMIWTNEEGAEYLPSMMSSGVVCNEYMPKDIAVKFRYEDMLSSISEVDGERTFEEALKKSGYMGKAENRINNIDYKAMFELHIEQGPILQECNKDIGVVNCVIGSSIHNIKIRGKSEHAGTTPMKNRQDALYAAAQVITYLHNELDKLDRELVYTTGEIKCHPNIHTIIPDYIEFTLDARHEKLEVLAQVSDVLRKMPKTFAKCSVDYDIGWTRDTVYFDNRLVADIQEAVDQLGYSNRRINSGAGHDAQFVSYMLPTAMIFVPSVNGHSHCEEEYTPVDLCTKGASVLLNAVLKCDNDKISGERNCLG